MDHHGAKLFGYLYYHHPKFCHISDVSWQEVPEVGHYMLLLYLTFMVYYAITSKSQGYGAKISLVISLVQFWKEEENRLEL